MLASITLAALTLGLLAAPPDTTELKADSLLKVLKQLSYRNVTFVNKKRVPQGPSLRVIALSSARPENGTS